MKILFDQWTPDRPGVASNLSEAKNVIPTNVGYLPLEEAEDISNAADQNLYVSIPVKFAGTQYLFAAGSTKLYLFNDTTINLDNRSRIVSAYTSTDFWDHALFGNVLIMSNGKDILQGFTLGSSAAFNNLDAAAPAAKYVTVVRDFVVAAGTTADPNKVFWSDVNDETNWTPGTGSQSDSQFIPDGGDIMGITGGEFGIVLLERSIYRMTYIGAPLYFQFDNITRSLGCMSRGSIVQSGGFTYFLSDDGFYVCDGQTVKPIGNDRVDKWFFDNVAPTVLQNISAAIDPVNKVVIWGFENTFAQTYLLIYNWAADKWSYAQTTADYVSTLASVPVSVEGLDLYSASLDALPASLDSRLWAGGQIVLGGVRDAKIVTFSGNPLTAVLTTGDIEQPVNTMLRLARPLVANGSATVSVASRFRLDGNLNYSTAVAASSENRIPLRSIGRYHRVSLTPTGNWTNATGVEVEIVPAGGR
jgi:hypothetical protein